MKQSGTYTGRKIRRKDGRGEHVIGEMLGSGGEATVYAIEGSTEDVIKIYHPGKEPTGEAANKLQAMDDWMTRPKAASEPGHPALAWPSQVVTGNSGQSVQGFLMPRVNENSTMEIGKYFHEWDRNDKIGKMGGWKLNEKEVKYTIIRNLSKIVSSVHQAGHVIGDINEKNFLVNPQTGQVSLVDCDSLQIRDNRNKRVYLCRVGRLEYTSPEILREMVGNCWDSACPSGSTPHEKKYTCIGQRTTDHDLFGMAVLIFQVLMDGTHPFDCVIEGYAPQAGTTRKDKILNGYYPFSRNKPPNIRIRNNREKDMFASIPEPIKEMFERSFASQITR